MKANIKTVSYHGLVKKRYAGEAQNIEIYISQDDYCKHCLQTHEHCHKKVHADYIRNKIFSVFKDRVDMCGSEHIVGTIKQVYNESRKMDICACFRFYDTTEEKMPGCVE